MPIKTPKLGLNIPDVGQTDWAALIAENWNLLDATAGAFRPTVGGVMFGPDFVGWPNTSIVRFGIHNTDVDVTNADGGNPLFFMNEVSAIADSGSWCEGLEIDNWIKGSSKNFFGLDGIYSSVYSDHVGHLEYLDGGWFAPGLNGNGNVKYLNGIVARTSLGGWAGHVSTASADNAFGVSIQNVIGNGGTVGTMAGINIDTPNIDANTTIGSLYGIKINNIGSRANSYAIYSLGGANVLESGSPTVVPLTLKSAAAQTADALQIQDSTGAALAKITKDGFILTPDGTVAAPAYSYAGAPDTGMFKYSNMGTAIAWRGNMTHTFYSSGNITTLGTSCGLYLNNDARIERDAADILALRRSAIAQTLRVYNSFTDASNYERLAIIAAGTSYSIGPENAGTGANRVFYLTASNGVRYISIGASSGAKWNFASDGSITGSGNLYLPAGTAAAPSLTFGGSNTSGFYQPQADRLELGFGGNGYFRWGSNQQSFGSGVLLGWSSATDPQSAVPDVAFSRLAAATLGLGNGTQGDTTGALAIGAGSAATPSVQVGNATQGIYASGIAAGSYIITTSNGKKSFFVGQNTWGSYDISGNVTMMQNAIAGRLDMLVGIGMSGGVSMSGADTGVTRISAKVVGIGSATAGDFSGTLKSANIITTTNATIGGSQAVDVVPLTVKAVASQTAYMISVQDSVGASKLSVDTAGNINAASINANSGFVLGGNTYATQGGNLGWQNRSCMISPTDGKITLLNVSGTDFTMLQFGGQNSNFPALKRNGTNLQIRLADDSGFGTLEFGKLTSSVAFANPNPMIQLDSSIMSTRLNGEGLVIQNNYTGGGWARPLLMFQDQNTACYFQFGGYGGGQSFNNAFIGTAYNQTWQVWMPNGKIGMGTANPQTRLHVAGTATSDVGRFDMGIDLYPVTNAGFPPCALVNAAGNVDAGKHYYYVTFYTATGETALSPNDNAGTLVTTDASHGQVTVTLPTSADYRVVGRRVYRSPAASDTSYWANVKMVADIPNNTDTSYTDNVPDSALTGNPAYFKDNTTSQYISINGAQSMLLSASNTAIGYQAGLGLINNKQSGQNVFVGSNAGKLVSTGTKMVLIGYNAGNNISTGGDNVGIGWAALGSLTTGSGNIAIGRNAIGNSAATTSSVAIGTSALATAGASSNSVVIGAAAGYKATGNYNIFLGYQAGYNHTTGQYNIVLGYNIDAPSYTGNNQLTIGNLIFGTGVDGTGQTVSTGKIGIATVNPDAKFDVHTDAGVVGLAVQAAASQTANLQEWRDSTGAVTSYVAGDGKMYAKKQFTFGSDGGPSNKDLIFKESSPGGGVWGAYINGNNVYQYSGSGQASGYFFINMPVEIGYCIRPMNNNFVLQFHKGAYEYNNATGQQITTDFTPQINQSGTAGYTGIRLSPYLKAVGSGSQMLLDLGTNSAAYGAGTHTSVFSVDATGAVQAKKLSVNGADIIEASIINALIFG